MNIGIDLTCLYTFFDGGKDQVIFNLLKGFRELGYERQLSVIAYDYSESMIRQDLPNANHIIVKRSRLRKALQDIWIHNTSFPRYIKENQLQLVFFPKPNANFKRFRIPTIILPHDTQFRSFPERFTLTEHIKGHLLYDTAFRLRDRIIAISAYDAAEICKYYPRRKEKVVMIHNPIDFLREGNASAHTLDIPVPFMMTVNIAYPQKNTITLLKAFRAIVHRIPHRLVLVGRMYEEENELTRYVKENRLEHRVIFTGRIDDSDLIHLLKNCALYVNPSRYEGFGMTPIEAMGLKVPVISSAEAALRETTKGLVRYYEPADNPLALSEGIMQLLETPPDEEELERNRKAVFEAYHYKKIAEQYWELFTRVIEGSVR
jgi:glycosyltransferase involved in cell wall biosynthesis